MLPGLWSSAITDQTFAVRDRVLVRDGWNCRYCGDLAVQVHHTRYDLSWSNPGTLVSVPPKAPPDPALTGLV
jgi:hypothetical protein